MNKPIRTFSLSAVLSIFSFGLGVVPGNVVAQPVRAQTETASKPVGEIWNRTELYFGTERPNGSEVSSREFRHFVDAHITPRFPDGLTLLPGSGQWREADGDIIKERSVVLVLLYPREDSAANRKIQAIRNAYKRTFAQTSVLRVDSLERVSF